MNCFLRKSQVGEPKYRLIQAHPDVKIKAFAGCNFDFKLEKREKPGALNAESSL